MEAEKISDCEAASCGRQATHVVFAARNTNRLCRQCAILVRDLRLQANQGGSVVMVALYQIERE